MNYTRKGQNHSQNGLGSSEAHTRLVKEIHLAVGSMPDCRAWVRNVGFDENRKIKYGVNGESDIQFIMNVNGLGIMGSIEVKTGNAGQSTDQKNYEAMIKKFGGIYFVARSVEDATIGIEKAKLEILEKIKKVVDNF